MAPAIPPGSDRFAFHVSMIVSLGSSWSAAVAKAFVVRSTAAMPASCVLPVSWIARTSAASNSTSDPGGLGQGQSRGAPEGCLVLPLLRARLDGAVEVRRVELAGDLAQLLAVASLGIVRQTHDAKALETGGVRLGGAQRRIDVLARRRRVLRWAPVRIEVRLVRVEQVRSSEPEGDRLFAGGNMKQGPPEHSETAIPWR